MCCARLREQQFSPRARARSCKLRSWSMVRHAEVVREDLDSARLITIAREPISHRPTIGLDDCSVFVERGICREESSRVELAPAAGIEESVQAICRRARLARTLTIYLPLSGSCCGTIWPGLDSAISVAAQISLILYNATPGCNCPRRVKLMLTHCVRSCATCSFAVTSARLAACVPCVPR